MRTRVRSSLPILVGLVVAAVVVTGGEPTADAKPVRAELTPVACDDPLFADRLPAGEVECYTLAAPENRNAPPNGAQVVLPVAIVQSTAAEPAPDPVVLLAGGPGDSGFVPAFVPGFGPVIAELAAERDVILLDQRGTGLATPSLYCPETTEALFTILGTTDDPLEERPVLEQAYRSCLDRLRTEGVDLEQYDTQAAVADLEDLRRLLGVAEWNVYGQSYGTTVALEMIRRHPMTLRSVTLDAALPAFADSQLDPAAIVADAKRAFETVYARCDADSTCPFGKAGVPDLETLLGIAQERWNATPYETKTIDPITQTERTLYLTGDDAVWALFKAQYVTPFVQILPLAIASLADYENDDPFPFALFVNLALPVINSLSRGTYAAVTCADRVRVAEPTDLQQLRTDEPIYSSSLVEYPQFPELCDAVDVKPAESAFNKVKATKVPTLVFAGDNDPATPPADGALTAELLGEQATFVEFPGIGHISVGAFSPAIACPDTIFLAFVSDPLAPIDTSCVAPGS